MKVNHSSRTTFDCIVDDPKGLLSEEDQDIVIGCIESAAQICGRILPSSHGSEFLLTIVSGQNCPEVPIGGGYANGRCSITLDTDFPVYKSPERDKIIATVVAHEWHHAVRDQKPGYGNTIGHTLVSEGLAQAFEVQVVNEVPSIAIAVPKNKLLTYEDHMKALLRKKYDPSRKDFLSGGSETGYPKWFGYSFAYALMETWLCWKGKTAAGAVHVSANQILKPWQNGELSLAKAKRTNRFKSPSSTPAPPN